MQLDDTLLLIKPEAAKSYEAALLPPPSPPDSGKDVKPPPPPPPVGAQTFIGTVDVNATAAKVRLVQIAEEIISVLASDLQANVKMMVEIGAEFPSGVLDQIRRAVPENAASLECRIRTWE